jgi:hypothetical protein
LFRRKFIVKIQKVLIYSKNKPFAMRSLIVDLLILIFHFIFELVLVDRFFFKPVLLKLFQLRTVFIKIKNFNKLSKL